jgi:hypothetical protein
MNVDLNLKVCLQVTKTVGNFGCTALVQLIYTQNLNLLLYVSNLKYHKYNP